MFTTGKRETCLENMDSFDARTYDETLMRSGSFSEMERKGRQVLETFPSLQRDIWGSLYKYNPKLKTSVDDRKLVVNRGILEKVVTNPEFMATREYTRMDELASALNTLSLAEKLMDMISNKLDDETRRKQEELEKLQNDIERNECRKEVIEQKMESLEKKIENAGADDRKNMEQQLGQVRQQLKQAGAALKKAGKAADKVQQELQQLVQHMVDNSSFEQAVGNMISSSANESQELAQEVETLSGRWGSGSNGGTGNLLDKLNLAQSIRNSLEIRKVLKLAGRMKTIALNKRKQKCEESTLKQDVETGNCIERLLPSELLLYSNPGTRMMFLKKLAEGECLQYSTMAKEKLGEGPMVCCVDVSGSMKRAVHGSDSTKRAEWAKAVAYALWSVARKQRRRFYLIEFDDCIIDSFEVDNIRISDLLTVKHLGGTNFEIPLTKAFDTIRVSGVFRKADIIMITDGDAGLSGQQIETILQMKKMLKTSIYSIQLGKGRQTLELFSDRVICHDGGNSFTEVFEMV